MSHPATQDGRLVKAARFLERHGTRVAYGISLLILTVVGLAFSLRSLSGTWVVIWWIIIIVLAVVAAIFLILSIRSEFKQNADIESLREQVKNAETKVSDLEDTVGVFSVQ